VAQLLGDFVRQGRAAMHDKERLPFLDQGGNIVGNEIVIDPLTATYL
jgi:hypothetical protein